MKNFNEMSIEEKIQQIIIYPRITRLYRIYEVGSPYKEFVNLNYHDPTFRCKIHKFSINIKYLKIDCYYGNPIIHSLPESLECLNVKKYALNPSILPNSLYYLYLLLF